MSQLRCESCRKGKMRRVVLRMHRTRLGGMPITVEQARVLQCAECGEIAVPAEELKRWRSIQTEKLQKSSALPSAEEVSRVRVVLGASVAEFAFLLGVTRQSVHGWEHGRLQPGPAAILIRLIQSELAGEVKGVIAGLHKQAELRGTPVLAGKVNVSG